MSIIECIVSIFIFFTIISSFLRSTMTAINYQKKEITRLYKMSKLESIAEKLTDTMLSDTTTLEFVSTHTINQCYFKQDISDIIVIKSVSNIISNTIKVNGEVKENICYILTYDKNPKVEFNDGILNINLNNDYFILYTGQKGVDTIR